MSVLVHFGHRRTNGQLPPLHLVIVTTTATVATILAVKKVLPLIKVQEDLAACLIDGSSIVFKFRYENEMVGTLPRSGQARVTFNFTIPKRQIQKYSIQY